MGQQNGTGLAGEEGNGSDRKQSNLEVRPYKGYSSLVVACFSGSILSQNISIRASIFS